MVKWKQGERERARLWERIGSQERATVACRMQLRVKQKSREPHTHTPARKKCREEKKKEVRRKKRNESMRRGRRRAAKKEAMKN